MRWRCECVLLAEREPLVFSRPGEGGNNKTPWHGGVASWTHKAGQNRASTSYTISYEKVKRFPFHPRRKETKTFNGKIASLNVQRLEWRRSVEEVSRRHVVHVVVCIGRCIRHHIHVHVHTHTRETRVFSIGHRLKSNFFKQESAQLRRENGREKRLGFYSIRLLLLLLSCNCLATWHAKRA